MPRTFEEKYQEAKRLSHARLVENNKDKNEAVYKGGENTGTLYINNEYVIKMLSAELSTYIGGFGITQSEIKENYPRICKDVLETLQTDPRFTDLMERSGLQKKGIIDLTENYALENEDLDDPQYKNSSDSIFGIDSEKKIFNNILGPERVGLTLNGIFKDIKNNSSVEDINKALFTLATAKKVHDSRPFFGRPEGYKEEGKAIDSYTKTLKCFGLTDKDINDVFKCPDNELSEKVEAVTNNRFVTQNGRVDQNDYSRANFNKISPGNLEVVFAEEQDYILGGNPAKHKFRLLNAYIAGKDKYEKAGFFKKYFSKDYRDLKKSIDNVEKFLTTDKNMFGEKRNPLFTKAELKDLARREQPLTLENDLQFLHDHHMPTVERVNPQPQQEQPQQQNQVQREPFDLNIPSETQQEEVKETDLSDNNVPQKINTAEM